MKKVKPSFSLNISLLPWDTPESRKQVLNAAVMDAYAFNPASDSLKQLLELNLRAAAGEAGKLPVQAWGLPGWVEEKGKYVGDECVRFEG